MVVKDNLFLRDEDGNRIYVTKEGHWHGVDKKKLQLNLNQIILILEGAGFNIGRIEKTGGNVMLEVNEEAIENEFDVSK